MTPEELERFNNLEKDFKQLKDVFYRQHFIDKDFFPNKVYFNNDVIFTNKVTYQRNIITTTSTTTALHTSTLGLYGDGLLYVTAVINGKNGTAKYGSYTLKAVIKFVFGAATILASTVTTEYEDDATWNVTITTSGNNYLINVVSSADSILWSGVVEEFN